ncbi:CD82 antigen [Nelusetta ayraudi]|uniref:CD82 antigen n=1 Tax=Nelusetta ayraudi TaxID=303726 RepID=UPI003F7006D8
MAAESNVQVLSFCFLLFNCVFLVVGLSVGGCGSWILFDGENLLKSLPSDALKTVAGGLLAIGGAVLLVAVIGCVGVRRGNRLLLLTYLGLLLVLLLGQLFVAVLLLISRNKIERGLDEVVDDTIHQYGLTAGSSRDRLMDNIQSSGRCCGRTGPSDWLRNKYIQNLSQSSLDVFPCSCFNSTQPVFDSSRCSAANNTLLLYMQGCETLLHDWLNQNILTIIGMDFGLILIQVLQLVFSVCLYQGFHKRAARKTLRDDSDHAPLDETLSDSDSVDHAPHGQLANDDDLSPDGHSATDERLPENGPQHFLSDHQQQG